MLTRMLPLLLFLDVCWVAVMAIDDSRVQFYSRAGSVTWSCLNRELDSCCKDIHWTRWYPLPSEYDGIVSDSEMLAKINALHEGKFVEANIEVEAHPTLQHLFRIHNNVFEWAYWWIIEYGCLDTRTLLDMQGDIQVPDFRASVREASGTISRKAGWWRYPCYYDTIMQKTFRPAIWNSSHEVGKVTCEHVARPEFQHGLPGTDIWKHLVKRGRRNCLEKRFFSHKKSPSRASAKYSKQDDDSEADSYVKSSVIQFSLIIEDAISRAIREISTMYDSPAFTNFAALPETSSHPKYKLCVVSPPDRDIDLEMVVTLPTRSNDT